jgi:hypothetical protein
VWKSILLYSVRYSLFARMKIALFRRVEESGIDTESILIELSCQNALLAPNFGAAEKTGRLGFSGESIDSGRTNWAISSMDLRTWALSDGGLVFNLGLSGGHYLGALSLPYHNLYYYIKYLKIGRSIFYHGNFLSYPFYLSIRRIIFIFG